ncbi:MAG: GAF domain-containing protein, partial [Burkholderiaceae bacterium]|nr:GAF domain-containing protein [Burkholderiaceae bacterium]
MLTSPAFGQADLSNCERELIHLAGSVQPHGVLLVIDAERRVLQATANAAALLGRGADSLLGRPLADLGGDLDARVAQRVRDLEPERTAPLTCSIDLAGTRAAIEGGISCLPGLGWMVELEPMQGAAEAVSLDGDLLIRQLGGSIQQLSTASSLGVLADGTVKAVRELTGYDRVMVYRFDPDGHGKVIAEARHPRLEALLGHHYPATDIPQRARELY